MDLICHAFVSAGEVLWAHSLPGRANHASDVLNFKPQRLGSNHVQIATETVISSPYNNFGERYYTLIYKPRH